MVETWRSHCCCCCCSAVASARTKGLVRREADKPSASGKPPTPVFKPLTSYNQIVKAYDNKAAAHKDLGVDLRVKSHCARVFKTRDNWSLLYCKLHPVCKWTSALFRSGERWELRAAADRESSQHNADCQELRGQRGFDTLEQRKAMEKQFTGTTSPVKP